MSRTLGITAAIGLLLAVGVIGMVSASQEEPVVDLGDGLSDAEEEALYRSLSDDATVRQLAAVRDFMERGGDPRALRQMPQMSTAEVPPETLIDALGSSDAAVYGKVRSVDFAAPIAQANFGSFVELEIISAAGRDAPNGTITIHHPASMEVDLANPDQLVLSVPDMVPALFESDVVLLFVVHDPQTDRFGILPYVGWYLEHDGHLDALDSNPFGSQLEGRTATEAIALAEAALGKE